MHLTALDSSPADWSREWVQVLSLLLSIRLWPIINAGVHPVTLYSATTRHHSLSPSNGIRGVRKSLPSRAIFSLFRLNALQCRLASEATLWTQTSFFLSSAALFIILIAKIITKHCVIASLAAATDGQLSSNDSGNEQLSKVLCISVVAVDRYLSYLPVYIWPNYLPPNYHHDHRLSKWDWFNMSHQHRKWPKLS